jgi:hypothetical protein
MAGVDSAEGGVRRATARDGPQIARRGTCKGVFRGMGCVARRWLLAAGRLCMNP